MDFATKREMLTHVNIIQASNSRPACVPTENLTPEKLNRIME